MSRTRRVLELATLAAMLCGLTGCPLFFPSLDVNPLALHFDSTDEIRSFRIANAGAGILTWQASIVDEGGNPITDLVYLSSRIDEAKQVSDISGSLSNQQAIVEVALPEENRLAFLDAGEIYVNVTSNAGTAQVRLTASFPFDGEATFETSTDTLDFGVSLTNDILTISNNGTIPLEWVVDEASVPTWVVFTPEEGEVQPLQSQNVRVTVNRTNLAPGDYSATITFTTNAGPAAITITMTVPPFSARPNPMDFGTIARPSTMVLDIISNMPVCLVPPPVPAVPCGSLTIQITESEGWLDISQNTITLSPLGAAGITVTADPTTLTPGEYTTQIFLTLPDSDPSDAIDDSFEFVVDVVMVRSGIEVEPLLLDFGGLVAQDTMTFVVRNIGGNNEPYFITLPTGTSAWLGVEGTSLNDSPNAVAPAETDIYTVTVDPRNVLPGTFEADVIVNFTGGQETVTIRMVAERLPDLIVTPQDIDFGTTRNQESIGIINGGTTGVISWTINTTGFPAWLTLRPVNGAGVASGTLTGGNSAQSVILELLRSAIPPNVSSLNFSFDVVGSGDVSEVETVNVSVSNTLLPDIVVIGDQVSNAGVQEVNIPQDEDTDIFIIRNDGFGNLEWTIIGSLDPADPTELLPVPDWIQGLSPSQDTLVPSLQQNVTIRVDRTLLPINDAPYTTLLISTNDPNASTDPENPNVVRLNVIMGMPRLVILGVRPSELGFGVDAIAGVVEVANLGDPGTMNYIMSCDKDWVNFFPTAGASEGTDSPIKDWRSHSVSVDRSQIQDGSDSAVITVYALKEGSTEIDDAIEPERVLITVNVPELTIETTKARLRVPSLVRHIMTLRNVQNETIILDEISMPDLLAGTTVLESGVPVEVTEDQKFMKKALPSRIRTNVLILLDYSNSMQNSASLVTDASISGALDPLQALYEQSISSLINELPDEFNVGLAIFNERSAFASAVRSVTTSSAETAQTFGNLFIQDKAVLLQRLDDLNVTDNGATELMPALLEANALLYEKDFTDNLFFPFDDADVRALICVTDGRQTTPPASLAPVLKNMVDLNIKFLPLGWGDAVQTETLVQMAFGSGGHLYTCPSEPSGQVDQLGNQLKVPSASSLLQWCETDLADGCDQSLAKDLSNQIIFNYVSLNENSTAVIDVALSFNDPTDNLDPETQLGGCLEDQGQISNNVVYPGYAMFDYSGDVNMGQISMSTEGIVSTLPGNEIAEIYVNLDAAPRNVSALEITFRLTELDPPDPNVPTVPSAPGIDNLTFTVEKVAETDGGLVFDWQDQDPNNETVLLQSTAGPLLMGDFGKLLKVTVSKTSNLTATPVFRLKMDITAPAYFVGDLNEKYFTAPDSIILRPGEKFKATSFPLPYLENFVPAPFALYPIQVDIGSSAATLQFDMANLGGNHAPTSVWLRMYLASIFGVIDISAPGPTSLVSTYERFGISVTMDRCQEAGAYIAEIVPSFDFNSLGVDVYQSETQRIYVHYTVTNPIMGVGPITANSTTTLAPNENQLQLSVSNLGQGILSWSINSFAFPTWLRANVSEGEISYCDAITSDPLILTVDRSQIPPASLILGVSHTFTVIDLDGNTPPFIATIGVRAPFFTVSPSIDDIHITSTTTTFPMSFTNTNVNGPLQWDVLNPTRLPVWMSFSQNTGLIAPNSTDPVDILINTALLPASLPVSQDFQIQSDGTIFNGTITVDRP